MIRRLLLGGVAALALLVGVPACVSANGQPSSSRASAEGTDVHALLGIESDQVQASTVATRADDGSSSARVFVYVPFLTAGADVEVSEVVPGEPGRGLCSLTVRGAQYSATGSCQALPSYEPGSSRDGVYVALWAVPAGERVLEATVKPVARAGDHWDTTHGELEVKRLAVTVPAV